MARSQLELAFTEWDRLELHLTRCRLSKVQAKLAALVRERGTEFESNDVKLWRLQISSRQAAVPCKCSDRAVAKAAATLTRWEWFRVIEMGVGKPPIYVLDYVAAGSLELDPLDRFDELTGASCEPAANQVRTSPRVLPEREFINPVSSSHLPYRAAVECAAGAQRFALPWSRRDGVTDADLVAAVRGADVELLRYLFDVASAPPLEWIRPASDCKWLDFLTACHHAATARLSRRMGRLVSFVKNGLDVSKCRQASDQWAGRMAGRRWRDPALARRLCEVED